MPGTNEAATTVAQTAGSSNSNTQGNANSGLKAGGGWLTAANMAAVAIPTNLLILGVQSPVKTVIVSLAQSGQFLPASRPTSIYGLVSFLYKGTQAAAAGSVARTAVVTTVKNNSKAVEATVATESSTAENLLNESESSLKKQLFLSRATYVMGGALWELGATQVPDTLSQLRKMPGFLPDNFKWKANLRQLATAAIVPRYMASVGSFFSMTAVEENIASLLPDHPLKHTFSGAASGVVAAISTYPLSAVKDYMLVNTTLSKDGKLVTQGLNDALLDLGLAYTANPREAVMAVAKNAAKRLPLSIGLTATIFSIISGVGAAMGPEPLNKYVRKEDKPSSSAATVSETAAGASIIAAPSAEASSVVEHVKAVTPKKPVLATVARLIAYTPATGYRLMAVTQKPQPTTLSLAIPSATTVAVSTASTTAAVESNVEGTIATVASPGANRYSLFGANSSANTNAAKSKKSPSTPAAEGTAEPKAFK